MWRSARILVGVALGLTPGCDPFVGGESCATYGCVNSAGLSGTLQLPDAARRLDAKFCGAKSRCVRALIDVPDLAAQRACSYESDGWGDSICFTRSAAGQLEVQASLYVAGEEPPADAEAYTLLITEHDSGVVLVDETREANYEITREDSCHTCWGASMSL